MSWVLNNKTTADVYTEAVTIRHPPAVRLNIDVHNAAVYYQLGSGEGGGIEWDTEVFLTPSFRGLDRRFDAVRVRSAVAGKPAQVTVQALTASEVGE